MTKKQHANREQKIRDFQAKLRAIENWRLRLLDTLYAAKTAKTKETRETLIDRAIEIASE